MDSPGARAHSPSHLRQELEAVASLHNYHRWIFEEIRPYLGQQIAEIGGGIGTFSKEIIAGHLHSNPSSCLEIFEPSACLYQELESALRESHRSLIDSNRLKTTAGSFHSPFKFHDSVLMVNVLEHIEHEDSILSQIYESLQPEGLLIIFVPALDWLFSALDQQAGHYRRYDKTRLRLLLERNRFTVIKDQYMDLAGVLPWYLLNVLGQSRSFNPTFVKLYDQWGVPFTRCMERWCEAPCGKNLLMVGRKQSPA
jgi:phospholipid N-methyltransferase